MPTYLYCCEKNDNQEFECFHSIKIELEECEVCKEKGMEQHKPKRLISGGSGRGIVELNLVDLKQKIKQDSMEVKKDIYSNEKAYANVLGDYNYQNLQKR